MKKLLLSMLSLIVSVGVSAETKSLNWSSEGSWSTWNNEYVDQVKQDAYAKCDNGTLTFKGKWTTIQYWMQGLANGYGRLTVTLTDNAPYDLYVEAGYSEGNSNGTITAGQKSVSIDLVAGKTVDKILFKGGSNWPTGQEASVTISTIEFSKPDFAFAELNMTQLDEFDSNHAFKIAKSAFDSFQKTTKVYLNATNTGAEKWLGGKIFDNNGWAQKKGFGTNIPNGNGSIELTVGDFVDNASSDDYVYIQYYASDPVVATEPVLTGSLAIAENQITITLTAAGIGSMMLPFNAEVPKDMQVYQVGTYEGNVLHLNSVDAIAANTPYIIMGEAKDYTFVGVAEAENFQNTVNNLCGTYESVKAPEGSYVLQNGNEGAGFYHVASGSEPTVTAYHAYLTDLPVVAEGKLCLVFDDETTGIDRISSVKADGNMVYNLNGQRVSRRSSNGIVIINGKKYLVK